VSRVVGIDGVVYLANIICIYRRVYLASVMNRQMFRHYYRLVYMQLASDIAMDRGFCIVSIIGMDRGVSRANNIGWST
jgi:hypothetical protein